MYLAFLVGFVTIKATVEGDNPNYLEQIFEDREFFAINTMHPCYGLEEQTNVPRDICQVSALLIRLNSAKIQIQQYANSYFEMLPDINRQLISETDVEYMKKLNRISIFYIDYLSETTKQLCVWIYTMFVISQHSSLTTGCTNPPSSYPHVNNGLSLEEILHSSFDLLTGAALNLTIINNHPLSVISSDVTSGVAEVLCELKRLLNLTPTRHLATVSKTLELQRQTSEDVTFFTCKTLRNVKKILRHVIRNIRSGRGNSDNWLPMYPRID